MKRQRILVVDGEVYIVHILDFSLSMEGYDVVTATGPAEALCKAEAEHPDLIVADIFPDENGGLEFYRRLRSELGLYDVPLILLHAGDRRLDPQQAHQAGVRAAFAKPFSPQRLAEEIREALCESRPSEQAAG